MSSTTSLIVDQGPDKAPMPRTSEILRGILSQNPGVESFSVERILDSIGTDHLEASLVMFAIPAIVPVPCSSSIASVSTGRIGYQLLAGKKTVALPRFILRKSVSRRALAVAIHAILPALEAAEQVVRPRWRWVNHSSLRRAIGFFIFLLALAIAYPLFGFNALHATSIFVMALGMAEQDGLAVLLGAAVGVVSLAMLVASGVSSGALRAKAAQWLRKGWRKLGRSAVLTFMGRLGYTRLAAILRFKWVQLLLVWNPEKAASKRNAAAEATNHALPARPAFSVSALFSQDLVAAAAS